MDVRFVQIDRFLHLLHFPLFLIFGRHIDDTFLGLNKNIAFIIREATVNECLKKLKNIPKDVKGEFEIKMELKEEGKIRKRKLIMA